MNSEIKPKFSHSKYGNFMFNICAKSTCFLIEHKILYYILACTWGAIMTFLGLLTTAIIFVAKIFDNTIEFKKYNFIYFAKIGPKYWGGCEMGLMFFRDRNSSVSVDAHEFGHTFQNCILGPLYPFLVAIPSAIRYWLRKLWPQKYDITPYDSFWAEDAASKCGEYANKML